MLKTQHKTLFKNNQLHLFWRIPMKKAKSVYGIDEISDAITLDLLGGKGYNLARMKSWGMPVPKAYVITTEVCRQFMKDPGPVKAHLHGEAIPQIIEGFKKERGHLPLMSVRSGAKVSMPGMMDTVLNVGLTKESMGFWEARIGDKAARDSRRRLMQMFGSVVFGMDEKLFEKELSAVKSKRRVTLDSDLTAEDLSEVIVAYEKVFQKGRMKMPDTVEEQLLLASQAVFSSWNNDRAKEYRRIHGYSDEWGTAVTIQEMVFGNLNDNSCTGVLFTRNPSTGKGEPLGEYLINAQGEDVVAGIRTPMPIYEMEDWNKKAYSELMEVARTLENTCRDMQDIEFTVQDGELFLLQTRDAKRSAMAAIKVAMDMSKEGLISRRQALGRISAGQYQTLCAPMIAPSFNEPPDVSGLAASTGIATGKAVFSSDDAVECADDCILIAEETTPEDLPGIHAAVGILTATGGVTSHAAVVARGMDKVCVVGAKGIEFIKDKKGKIIGAKLGDKDVFEGDTLTLDGASGRVWAGSSVPVVAGGELKEVLALNDMIFEMFPVYRVVTDGRDLHTDFKMVYATYPLDCLDADKIYEEIAESMPYLNGVVDLSTMEEHAPAEDEEILSLGGSARDDDIFSVKKRAVLSFMGERTNIKVYLGAREKEHSRDFTHAGYQVLSGVMPKKKIDGAVFAISESDPASLAAVWELARAGGSGAVIAVPKAPKQLLDDLGDRMDKGETIEPVIALSAQQLLACALKP